MAEYKRKKVHTGKLKRSKPDLHKPQWDIPVFSRKKREEPAEEEQQEKVVRVVKGKKGERRKKVLIFAAAVLAVILTLVILNAVLPVGLFESTRDYAMSLGSGSYPIPISGSGALNCVPKDNYYYVLTDTSIMAFTNGGKKIFSFVHGYSSPVLVTSQTRALLFDQGKNSAVIYNVAGVVNTIDSKDPIIAADIAKNGEYALVTKSNSYASSVGVYNRNGKSLYSINLAKDMINNIDIASSGKKIAVSTVNAESGKIISGVRVYGFKSAEPAFKLDLGQDMIYDIENTGNGFFVFTHNKARYIKWSNYNSSEYDFKGETASLRYSSSGVLAVYNKTNDKSDNTAVLFSNYGKMISEFEIKGVVNDIRFARGRVYAMSDNSITIFDKRGEVLKSGAGSFGGVKLAVTGSNTVCVISDNQIVKSDVGKG